MDFSYPEEQQMLQESVQKFVHKNYDFDTRKKIMASAAGYSAANWQLFAELGWLTVPFNEADSGFGGRAVDLMVMMEEFGRAMLVEPFLPTAILCGGLISELGSSAQKSALLPEIMGGELQLALAYAEAGSRFNLANVTTTAVRKGDEVILDGTKILVLNGPAARIRSSDCCPGNFCVPGRQQDRWRKHDKVSNRGWQASGADSIQVRAGAGRIPARCCGCGA